MDDTAYMPIVGLSTELVIAGNDALDNMSKAELSSCRNAIEAMEVLDYYLTSSPFAGSKLNVALGMAFDEIRRKYSSMVN